MGAFLIASAFPPSTAKRIAAQLVLSLEQVVALRYRTQDRVRLQQILLGRHELVIAGGEETIVADCFR